ncbi:hypothetical protein F4778DRAFT_106350 [Xylariomycetidae sp. FL2044]|nr:hypothetical protein F4778DRAFT_106350 [Xylariomycetidae sp. FL2044]
MPISSEHIADQGAALEEGHREPVFRPHEEAQQLFRRIWDSPLIPVPAPSSYPPISSIPRTSAERLAAAAASSSSPDGGPAPTTPAASTPSTVLYLAYGSNLAAATFLGRRGIRPLSQINVSAPAFDLCFDLPGLPYTEPAFANTTPRKIPKPPIPGDPPKFPPSLPPPSPYYDTTPTPSSGTRRANGRGRGSGSAAAVTAPKPTWNKGLYGVVYEVTPEDYATIQRTEGLGGVPGASYRDVLTPCVALPPPSVHVPEKPPVPELPPRPFLAHTLYAPRIPDVPSSPPTPPLPSPSPSPPGHGDEDEDDGDNNNDDEKKEEEEEGKKWYRRLLAPIRRPDPDYAQPSLRYLSLLRDGAREHGLPEDYVAYLDALPAYAITTWRAAAGRALVLGLTRPLFLLVRVLGPRLADHDDDRGNMQRWLAVCLLVFVNALWIVYDAVLKPVFGDGERTEEGGGAGGARGRDEGGWMGWGRRGGRGARRWQQQQQQQQQGEERQGGWGEEKTRLLGDW